MDNKRILDALGQIDDDLIVAAEKETKGVGKHIVWRYAAAVAACAALFALGVYAVPKMLSTKVNVVPAGTSSASQSAEDAASYGDPSEEPDDGERPVGVTIPKAKVDLSADGSHDMIGFFIYHGKVYYQYNWFPGEDVIADLRGKYVGTATGLINEWTKIDGYVELAGSVRGDIYEVKGFDPDFMLCLENSVYICVNGITLTTGSDLFENSLHLSDNYVSIKYETSNSWSQSEKDVKQLNNPTDITVQQFIDELDCRLFVPVSGQNYYNVIEKTLYHVYFEYENGFSVHLRLHEGGYVSFDVWELTFISSENEYCGAFVKIDRDTFNAFTSLLTPR